ncbi:MAG: LapA family protein [bacterium]|nr:LapA family protein [bacterium]
MIALILFIAFGLLFGYFATLNTSLASISFGSYTLEPVPLYLVILTSFGLGVLLSGLFSFVKSLGAQSALSKKNNELADAEKENMELLKRVHQLELETTRLKAKTGEESEDEDSL